MLTDSILNCLFSQLIRDLGITEKESQVGYYVGLMVRRQLWKSTIV